MLLPFSVSMSSRTISEESLDQHNSSEEMKQAGRVTLLWVALGEEGG
jgi:hypothetical protein